MRKILKFFIPALLFTAVIGFSSCDEEGKGRTYFSDTTWKATWSGTGNNADSCDITLQFDSDMTGKISFDFKKEENKDFDVDFSWDAWINNNNNDIPYVHIAFNVSDELQSSIEEAGVYFDSITAIDMAGSNKLSKDFSCALFEYVGKKYLGYTDVYIWSEEKHNSDGTISRTKTGTVFPQFTKQ